MLPAHILLSIYIYTHAPCATNAGRSPAAASSIVTNCRDNNGAPVPASHLLLAGWLVGHRLQRRRRGGVVVVGVEVGLPVPQHRPRLRPRPRPEPQPCGVDRDGGRVPLLLPAQGRRRLPCARLLQLHLLPPRRGGVPRVRRRRQRRHPEARGGGVPGADLPRDDRRVGDGARRPLRVGPVLQGGDQAAEQLLRRQQHGVAVLPRQVLPRPRANPALLELQLRAGGQGAGLRRAARPGGGGQRPGRGVQDGAVVLDDAAGAQAVVPRRDGGALPAQPRRPGGEPDGGVRPDDQHHQRRDRVRAPRQRRAGGRPDRVLPAVLRRARRRRRAQP